MHLLRTESLLVFYAGIGPALLMAPAAMVTPHISLQPPLPLPEPCHRHAPPHGQASATGPPRDRHGRDRHTAASAATPRLRCSTR